MDLALTSDQVDIIQIALLLMKKDYDLKPDEAKDVDEILAYIKGHSGYEPVV